MDPSFWLSRWSAGQTGFHRDLVHDDLVAHADRFLGDAPRRVLVPLCGRSRDLAWLAGRGHAVVGVELSPIAAHGIFEDAGLQPTVEALGSLERLRAGSISVLQGDVFEATAEVVGPIDRVWDRAALVALPAPSRARYAVHIASLLGSGGLLLQNAFTYDQSLMDGPPFSVSEEELVALYPAWTRALLGREILTEGKFVERGLTEFEESTWLLTAP